MSILEERFFARVQPAAADECWTWRGKPNQNGYGRFCNGSQRYVLAHRWAYELLIADIPADLVLDHLCRNRICVNPWHTEPVTIAENIRRGRQWESEKTHCPELHPYSEINTYIDPDGHRECRTCRRAADTRRRKRGRTSVLAA
jgi:HNH endonuclease